MREDSLEEGRRWLQQAPEDLHWAKDLAQRGGYYLACFLAQQVAEKALKAFLYTRGLEIVLGHSVERLSQEAAEWEPTIEKDARRWAVLIVTMCRPVIPIASWAISPPASTRRRRRKMCWP